MCIRDRIYGSKAWKMWGESASAKPLIHQGRLDKSTAELPFKSSDIRFTEGKDGSLYVWCMAVPKPGEIVEIKSLGTGAGLVNKPIKSVRLLGGPAAPHKQEAASLRITCPDQMPFQHAVGFKIEFN